jgi:hypothetical protein
MGYGRTRTSGQGRSLAQGSQGTGMARRVRGISWVAVVIQRIGVVYFDFVYATDNDAEPSRDLL